MLQDMADYIAPVVPHIVLFLIIVIAAAYLTR